MLIVLNMLSEDHTVLFWRLTKEKWLQKAAILMNETK